MGFGIIINVSVGICQSHFSGILPSELKNSYDVEKGRVTEKQRRGRMILITAAHGFMGRHLLERGKDTVYRSNIRFVSVRKFAQL